MTTTVIFDVPDGRPVSQVRDRFYEAHVALVGTPMETLTGQPYVLRAIERFEVVPLREEGE